MTKKRRCAPIEPGYRPESFGRAVDSAASDGVCGQLGDGCDAHPTPTCPQSPWTNVGRLPTAAWTNVGRLPTLTTAPTTTMRFRGGS